MVLNAEKERDDLELPWIQGAGGYSDALRIESMVGRVEPQGPARGLPLVLGSRIAYVMETRAGQGARAAAFIVRAANSHHDLVASLDGVLKAFAECMGADAWREWNGTSVHGPEVRNTTVVDALALVERLKNPSPLATHKETKK